MGQFDGIDVGRVSSVLASYVEETTPVNQSSNSSGVAFITASSAPRCGRERALELTARVRAVLDSLYPRWQEENGGSEHFEFQAQRDACQILVGQIRSHVEVQEMLGDRERSPSLVASELHALVWRAASAQWSTGHFQEAVLAAAKAVNSLLQDKVARRDLSDVKLVREAFAESAPRAGRPRLRYPDIQDDQTRESMRQGVQAFGAGCFQAIRNPVGHLPNEENEFTEQEALERLAALSLLARWIDEAQLQSI